MPISIRQRVTTCLVAVLVCAVGAGASAAQPPPPGAGLQTERFRLVVEGDAEAVRDLDLGGDNGICNAQVNVHVRETATWQRGRGVVVEFTRLGTGPRAPVFMRRVGSARPIFTVVVAVTRTSSGSATRTPSGPPEACPPLTEDLAQGLDCGVPQRDRAAISMLYAGGLMRMSHAGLGAVPQIDCPVSQVYGGTPDLKFGWPTPPALRPEPIAPALIFGTRRAFVVRAVSPRRRTTEPIASGPVSGSATDFGHNRVTVRFIRLP